MFGLGFSEVVLLAVLALIIIGPKQLPDVARTIGRFLNELKRATEDLKDEVKKQARVDLNMDQFSLRPDEPSHQPLPPVKEMSEEEKRKADEAYRAELGSHHDESEQLTLTELNVDKKTES